MNWLVTRSYSQHLVSFLNSTATSQEVPDELKSHRSPIGPGGDEGHLVGAAAGGSLWGNHLIFSFRASKKLRWRRCMSPVMENFM